MEMDKIQRIMFTESWQAYAIGTYAFSPYGSSEFKSNFIGTGRPEEVTNFPMLSTSADGKSLNTQNNRGGLWSLYQSYGSIDPSPTSLSVGYGQRNGAIPDGTAAGGLGFSIVSDPVRAGRKRLQFPATGATGRTTPTEMATDKFILRHLIDREASYAYNIAFVLRLVKGDGFGVLPVLDGDSTFLSLSLASFDARLYVTNSGTGIVGTTASSVTPFLVLNTKSYSVGTISSNTAFPNYDFVIHPTGDISSSGTVPDTNRLEFDRDYHVEVSYQFQNNEHSFSTYVDGVLLTERSVPNTATYLNLSRGFSLIFGKACRGTATSAKTRNPCHFQVSDIIVATRNSLTREPVIGANSRVWGESPSGDVKKEWSNPTDGTNASVVGAAMRDRNPATAVELEGGTGDEDIYSTDGSSLADYAGQVHTVVVKSLSRSVGGNDMITTSLRVDGVSVASDKIDVNQATSFYYPSFSLFPSAPDGQPWSVSDINKLEVGISVVNPE